MMRRDHSDHDTVHAALELDRERQPRPWHWLVIAILGAWFIVLLTCALIIRASEVMRG